MNLAHAMVCQRACSIVHFLLRVVVVAALEIAIPTGYFQIAAIVGSAFAFGYDMLQRSLGWRGGMPTPATIVPLFSGDRLSQASIVGRQFFSDNGRT
jgi:hypothetical protein